MNHNIYEQYDWNSIKYSSKKPKIDWLIKSIPADVRSILDVGCGNGLITNELAKFYQVTGLDISKQALNSVNTETIWSNSSSIPMSDNSFDLVMASELLEHLDEVDFILTVAEMKRISRKYILISVPNAENLEKTAIACEQCGFRYNRSYHLRNFTVTKLNSFFKQYELITYSALGKKIRRYNRFLSYLKHKITPPTAWIPYYWTGKEKRKTTCPKCEYNFDYKYKFHLLSFFIDMVNILFSRKKPYWILALYEYVDSHN